MQQVTALPTWNDRWALFLNVDGTLLEFADKPDAVRSTPRLKVLLQKACLDLGGAVALVSGREIAGLDRLFAPLRLPAAGLHGAERRSADGALEYLDGLGERLGPVKRSLMRFVERHAGLLLEDKGPAVALHYRRAPALGEECGRTIALAAQAAGDGFHVQSGKMVYELKPHGQDKGTAVVAFMDEPPFAGRTPVFIGDDVTDEDGFRAANRMGGLSIRVGGAGETAARYRIDTVERLIRWLEANLLEAGHDDAWGAPNAMPHQTAV
jgi:trehalose 6-phosphate phosphatase